LPQPDKPRCPKAARDNRKTGAENVAFVVAVVLFIGLTFFFFAELLFILSSQRPFHRFLIACLLTSVFAGCYVPRKFSQIVGGKILCGVFILIIVGSAVFILHNRLPLTGISLTLRSVAGPSDFLLWQCVDNRGYPPIKVHRGASRHPVSIDFRLPSAIRGRSKPFKINLGRASQFYDVLNISFDTRVLLWPIALVNYRGADILKRVGVTKNVNRFEVADGAVRFTNMGHGRPPLELIMASDENDVRRNTTNRRIYEIKLLWFFLYTGMSSMVIWHTRWPGCGFPAKRH